MKRMCEEENEQTERQPQPILCVRTPIVSEDSPLTPEVWTSDPSAPSAIIPVPPA